jgi:hypothetical protein
VRTRKLEQVLCGHVLEGVKRLEQEKSNNRRIPSLALEIVCASIEEQS